MKRIMLSVIMLMIGYELTAQQWLGSSTSSGDVSRSGNVGIGQGTTIPTGNLHVSAGTTGKCELKLEADTDNNNENDNPFISFIQDGGNSGSFIGTVGDNNTAPQMPKYARWFQNPNGSWSSATDYPGTLANYLLLGSGDGRGVQIGTFGYVRLTVHESGNVGIGTNLASNPNNYRLAVNGKIGAKEVVVENTSTTWPDYVFEDQYRLPSLTEVALYIKKNKHLPDVPSADEVKEEGHKLGEMDAVLLKKIEELTLYMIELKNKNEDLERRITELQSKITTE